METTQTSQIMATSASKIQNLETEGIDSNTPLYVTLTDKLEFKDSVVVHSLARAGVFVFGISAVDGGDKVV